MTVLECEREVLLGCGDEDMNDDTHSDVIDYIMHHFEKLIFSPVRCLDLIMSTYYMVHHA